MVASTVEAKRSEGKKKEAQDDYTNTRGVLQAAKTS